MSNTKPWKTVIKRDIVRGQFNEIYGAYIYYEVFYLLSSNGETAFIHFYNFFDWEQINNVLKKILQTPDFTPEDKPSLWKKAVDFKKLVPYKKSLKWRFIQLRV